jgi:glycopeptide antibiotics resistance protein
MARKVFTAVAIATAALYGFVLYYMLFHLPGREMVMMPEDMLDNYNYWSSVNLIPFKTIAEYISAVIDGSMRGHAIRNLLGNLFLFFPAGFYLPFFVRKAGTFKIYSIVMAALIIVIEIMQLATKSGSLDVDDFILNFAGALIGLLVFTRTPIYRFFKLRAWQEKGTDTP